ncbi:MAG: MarR family transcriptional regulator [Alphaproteobacteria bacterium]|nr:MarR family transcriptional regulator [Alphaproteobacteria bacterium]
MDDGGDLETALNTSDLVEIRVWLRLLTCTNLVEQRIRQNLRQEFGITLPRFDLLAQLQRAPDGLTMGELSRRLMVSNGNVTGMIERLVGEGLVERQSAPGDRRSQVVRLTAAGEDTLLSMLPVHHRWVEAMFEGLSANDMSTLFDLLAGLKRSVTENDSEKTQPHRGDPS